MNAVHLARRRPITLLLTLALAAGATALSGAAGCGNEEALEPVPDLVLDDKSDTATKKVVMKGELAFGDEVKAAFDAAKYHGYTFAGAKGALITISLEGEAAQKTDTVVMLYGPLSGTSWGGTPIAKNDDHGAPESSLIESFALPDNGEYLIVATCKNRSFEGKRYTLGLTCSKTCEPPPPSDCLKPVGKISVSSPPTRVARRGDLVYVAAQQNGLLVFDVSDPTHPTQVGSYPTTSWAQDLVIVGTTAFMGAKDLHILDISSPQPKLLGKLACEEGNTYDRVEVAGNYAYLIEATYGGSGLRIADIRDPAAPKLTFTGEPLALGAIANRPRVVGATLYVTSTGADPSQADQSRWDGLYVVDVTNPASPHVLGRHDEVLFAKGQSALGDVFVRDQYAFVVDVEALMVWDVSDPLHMTMLGYQVPDGPRRTLFYDLDVQDDLAFFASAEDGGVVVFDLASPRNPTQVAFRQMNNASRVRAQGEHVYVSTSSSSGHAVQILSATCR